MKKQNYLKVYLPWQSEFDRFFACWANNHRGWSKMKKYNRRLAKRREKRALRNLVSLIYSRGNLISKATGGEFFASEGLLRRCTGMAYFF